MTSLPDLKSKAHALCLNYRALDRLVRQDIFKIAWSKAGDAARSDIMNFVESGAVESVRTWVSVYLNTPLQEQSGRRLKERACELNVLGYSRMDRSELIDKIKEKEDAIQARDSSGDSDVTG